MRLEDIGKTVFLEVHFCEFSESDSKLRRKMFASSCRKGAGGCSEGTGVPIWKTLELVTQSVSILNLIGLYVLRWLTQGKKQVKYLHNLTNQPESENREIKRWS